MTQLQILPECDVLLVGAGIMSSTLGALLKELDPSLKIQAFERLNKVAQESTDAMNNAGTGHAANCELNYTPEKDGKVDISKALAISEQFEWSLQFWSYLIGKNALPNAQKFMNPVPHLSFVWGEKNVAFLKTRFDLLSAHPLFKGMEYSEDFETLKAWMPLVMEGRDPSEKVAATFMKRGTDVDFGALTQYVFDHLESQENFSLFLEHSVTNLKKQADGRWKVTIKNGKTGASTAVLAKFVFLGAGGGALPLLNKSGIPEGRGYGGFPVSGQWLVCTNPEVVARHSAKVYGKAAVGAPPMSVPHLDTRVIKGERALLFGPYAGFSTKFLKEGSYFDLPTSLNPGNLIPMMAVGVNNFDLTKYLVGQCLQSHEDRIAALKDFFPSVKSSDWKLEIAGQRVQIIKKDPAKGGKLEFGTEVVSAADGSIAALLGASPGASTAVDAMVRLIERCFKAQAQSPEWQAGFKKMIPSYGQSLIQNGELVESVRAQTNQALGLQS